MSTAPPSIPVRVTAVAALTPEVKQFRLEPLAGGLLPASSPVAPMSSVEMADGDLTRRNPYSLIGSPADLDHYAIAVRRDDLGRGGSRFLHDVAAVGTMLAISQPANLFAVELRARRHLLVAGGIGVTPFLAMMAQLDAAGAEYELHYAARSPGYAAFGAALLGRGDGRVRLYCSSEGRRLDCAAMLADQPLGTHLYVCGPEAMTDHVLATARGLGWPEQSLHQERFAAPARGVPYEVALARSGRSVRVGADQSMLEALEAAGLDVPSLCRGGACGQCETTVLACDGDLQHADHFLSEADKASGRKVMPCVSRFAGTALTIDL